MSNDSLSPTLLAVEAISCLARAPFALEYVIPPPSQWLFPSTLAWDVQSLTARGSIGQQFAECGIPTLAVGHRVISALAAARFGYLLVITIPLWDSQIHPESKIEGTLWAFGAISLGSLITIAVELVYAEFKAGDVILQPIVDRLAAMRALLNSYAAGSPLDENTKNEITHFAMLGTSPMRRTLQRSAYASAYRERMGALIALVGRLVDIAANVRISIRPSPVVPASEFAAWPPTSI